jgi:hypothetical protein
MLEKLKDLFSEKKEVKTLPASALKLSLRDIVEGEAPKPSECKELATIKPERLVRLPVKQYERWTSDVGKLICSHTIIDKSTMVCLPAIEIPLEEGELKQILRIQSLLDGKETEAEMARHAWIERNDKL